MRVLVIGGGGREHALAWKIADSPLVDQVYCAPGNAGIAEVAECVPIAPGDILRLRRFARENAIDLTVVGSEEPLVKGIVDSFATAGLRVFGPTREAARLEGSKVFCKQLMQRHGVPTAEFRTFNGPERAKSYLEMIGAPVVVKADGLAAGKAAIVCRTLGEAFEAVDRIAIRREFGEAGGQLVIESCLKGEEASVIAFTDGRTIAFLPSAQDHKAVYDGDRGPNTGGMGAYSPAPVITDELAAQIEREVFVQTVHAMNREEKPYHGVLYAGIMVTDDGPQVLEFNCRLGDPEAQALLMRLESDIVPVLLATLDGTLDQVDIRWDMRPTLCVVMASGGYPAAYEKGYPIEGLEDVRAMDDVMAFHAGTAIEDGQLVTSGGRVLGITARGETIRQARDRAYEAVGKIHFADAYWRTDIGWRAIERPA
ncbi:MAG: phosphoribosylamine--glycine ligase [Candidatus Brocadiaceae bacterium]|nr:phosphoribosylamine--glycine ligase [Candidatus Brocadiaceae bacterium]